MKNVLFTIIIALAITPNMYAAAQKKSDEAILLEVRVAEQRNNEEFKRIQDERAKVANDAKALKQLDVDEQRAKEEAARIAKLKEEKEYKDALAMSEYMKVMAAQKKHQADPIVQKKAAENREAGRQARIKDGSGW